MIVGLLSWYDEDPTWLATAVAGFGRFCDHIVAVDGAYELYPGGKARSHPEQAHAIHAAAEATGAGCTVHRPNTKLSEVEKRNLAVKLASSFDPEWLAVFDADLHVTDCDPGMLRAELAQTRANAAAYTIRDTSASGEWDAREPLIYRWTDDLAYVGNHYTITGTHNGVATSLRDGEALELLPSTLTVRHRRADRPLERRTAADGYALLRDVLQIEPQPA